MSSLLEALRSLKPITDDDKIMAILKELSELPPATAGQYFAQSHLGGGVYLYGGKAHPGFVVEYVQGHAGDDSVSTLFAANALFNDKTRYLKVREEAITEIARGYLALPSTIGIPDEGRGRTVRLNEMGLAQLADLLGKSKAVGVV